MFSPAARHVSAAAAEATQRTFDLDNHNKSGSCGVSLLPVGFGNTVSAVCLLFPTVHLERKAIEPHHVQIAGSQAHPVHPAFQESQPAVLHVHFELVETEKPAPLAHVTFLLNSLQTSKPCIVERRLGISS